MLQTRKVEQKGLLFRSFKLDTRTINEAERTVELSFSSENNSIEQWEGIVILDHKPNSIRLDRLNNSGPLLWMHNWDAHLGVIEQATISGKKGRAAVRFGNSPLAAEKFEDVKNKILVNSSVGFRIHKMILEERVENGLDIYRAIDWEPYEISFVTVAADTDVGVGRSAGEIFDVEIEEDRNMSKPNRVEENGGATNSNTNTPAAPQTRAASSGEPAVVVDVAAAENQARSAERTRTTEILSLGERHGCVDLAREHIDSGKSTEQMRAAILDMRPAVDDVGSGERSSELDLTRNDLKRYSIMRALNAALTGKWDKAGFERECSDTLADQLDCAARGFFLPQQVLLRSMNATNASDLIANEHMGGMFIEALRPNAVTMALGAIVMEGLQGNVEVPRELGTPSFSWISDDDDGNESEPGTGMIKMSPHTLSGGVPMSRRLLNQSSPSVEMVIQNSLIKGAALGLDSGVLIGKGTNNEPMGITNLTGVNTTPVASPGNPTWPEIVAFKSKVAADNAVKGNLAYVTTSSVTGNMETKSKDAGSGKFIMEDEKVGGINVAVSNQLTANTIIFGNWQDVMIGLWGVLDIVPDKATKARSGGLVLRIFQDADIGIGHPESFCINQ